MQLGEITGQIEHDGRKYDVTLPSPRIVACELPDCEQRRAGELHVHLEVDCDQAVIEPAA